MFFARGMRFFISLDAITISNPFYRSLSLTRIYFAPRTFISLNVVIALIVLVAGIYLAHRTRFGRSVYAIGGSEQSALLMGLPVARTKVLVYTLSIADRYVIATVLEPIRLELELTDSGIAFLTGVSLALFYVCFGFPLAWLIDRGNRRKIIAISVIAWSVMTTCSGLSRNYWELLLSRIGVGVGEAGGTPGANSILSDYFPVERRPMALTIFSIP